MIGAMRNIFFIFATSLLFIHENAGADQCAYITANTRDIAYNILKETNIYTDFCAPCGDNTPTEKEINKLEYKQTDYVENGDPFYQIYINDEPIDIAYIYIAGKNLGMLADCKPYGGKDIQYVPEYIDDYLTGKWVLRMDE